MVMIRTMRGMALLVLVALCGGVGDVQGSKETPKKTDIQDAYENVKNDKKAYKHLFQMYDSNGKKVAYSENQKGENGYQTLLLFALGKKDIDSNVIKTFLEAIKYGGTGWGIVKTVAHAFGSKNFGDDDNGFGYTKNACMQALFFKDKNGDAALHKIMKKVKYIKGNNDWHTLIIWFADYIVALKPDELNSQNNKGENPLYLILNRNFFGTAAELIKRGAILPDKNPTTTTEQDILWPELKKIFVSSKLPLEKSGTFVNEKWNFYKALKANSLEELFSNIKKVIKDFKNTRPLNSNFVLIVVDKIINDQNIDKQLGDLKNTSLIRISIDANFYKFYETLTKITIDDTGKIVEGVVFNNDKIAKIIKETQNKIASFLLQKLINASQYYSSWLSEKEEYYNYSYKKTKEDLLMLCGDFENQFKLIVLKSKLGKNSYDITEVKSNISTNKLFLFRSLGIDEECVLVNNQKKTIKKMLEDALTTTGLIYINVWLFDQIIRDKEKIAITINNNNIEKFLINLQDYTDISRLLGKNIGCNNKAIYSNCVLQENINELEDVSKKLPLFTKEQSLKGFNTYVVNVYMAVKYIAWAKEINKTINYEQLTNAIKKLEDALISCTGPTVKLDELRNALGDFATTGNDKKLYDVKKIEELSGGEFKKAFDDWKKQAEEEVLKKKEFKPEDLQKALSLLKAKLLSLSTQLKNKP